MEEQEKEEEEEEEDEMAVIVDIKNSINKTSGLMDKIKTDLSSIHEYLSHLKREFDAVKKDLTSVNERF